jgi:hypothetical protein
MIKSLYFVKFNWDIQVKGESAKASPVQTSYLKLASQIAVAMV